MTNAELREYHRGLGSIRVTQINSGFPLRSLRNEEWSGNPDTRFFAPTAGHDAFDLSGFKLPKRPIWSGMIINAPFYALLLWLLIPVPAAVRIMIRLKRGLCGHCGYEARERSVDFRRILIAQQEALIS